MGCALLQLKCANRASALTEWLEWRKLPLQANVDVYNTLLQQLTALDGTQQQRTHIQQQAHKLDKVVRPKFNDLDFTSLFIFSFLVFLYLRYAAALPYRYFCFFLAQAVRVRLDDARLQQEIDADMNFE